ncbi:MAG: Hsp20/alpha crystallin family protein [Bacilli bacterium]|nr:Hsp20/alpha crystallin family protein [Bacilli bacterium]
MLPNRIFFDNFLEDLEPRKFDKMMKCDIYEEDDVYHIIMDVPGFKKEDISLEYEDGYLKIKATHEEEEKSNKKYMRRERTSIQRCERSFYLGELNEDMIKAEFKDGILKVSVPKTDEKETSKKIINID